MMYLGNGIYSDAGSSLSHGVPWKDHKYVNIVNGRYFYPEDIKKAKEANKAKEGAKALFGGAASLDNVPEFELELSELENGINVMDLVVKTNFIPSKSEARRLIQQGGLCLNDEKVIDFNYIVKKDDLKENYILIKKGKKNFLKVIFN